MNYGYQDNRLTANNSSVASHSYMDMLKNIDYLYLREAQWYWSTAKWIKSCDVGALRDPWRCEGRLWDPSTADGGVSIEANWDV